MVAPPPTSTPSACPYASISNHEPPPTFPASPRTATASPPLRTPSPRQLLAGLVSPDRLTALRPGVRPALLRARATRQRSLLNPPVCGVPRAPLRHLPAPCGLPPARGYTVSGALEVPWPCKGLPWSLHHPQAHRPLQPPSSSSAAGGHGRGIWDHGWTVFHLPSTPRYLKAVQSVSYGRD